MDFIAAWTATVEVFNKVFTWNTGGRTREENSLRAKIEEAERAYRDAITNGDLGRANNAWILLRRLQSEAAAKRT